MWAASESRASDEASTPATTSASMNATIRASAALSAPRSVSRDGPWCDVGVLVSHPGYDAQLTDGSGGIRATSA